MSSSNQDNPSELTSEMKRLENSNDPKDVATLAYIWGYPLILVNRHIDFTTSLDQKKLIEGPILYYVRMF